MVEARAGPVASVTEALLGISRLGRGNSAMLPPGSATMAVAVSLASILPSG